MIEYLNLDSVPLDENCTSPKDGLQPQIDEAKKMIAMLTKRFPNCNKIKYKINHNPHDFGTYIDIKVLYDDENEESESQALFVEENFPMTWTDEEIFLWEFEEETEFADK